MVQAGEAAEIRVASELMELGYPVSKPLGDNEPYDLIADFTGDLIKVQVKRAHNRQHNSVGANLYKHSSESDKSQGKEQYRASEVDAFALVNDEIYWVWFDESPDSRLTISLKDKDEVRPQDASRMRFAEDFKLQNRL